MCLTLACAHVYMHCSVQLQVQPVSDSILEQLNKPSLLPTRAATLEEEVEEGGQREGREELYEPSPFSTKREMYSGKVGSQVSAHIYTLALSNLFSSTEAPIYSE